MKLKIRDPLDRDHKPPEFREFGGPFHDGPLYYGINSDTDTVISRTFPKAKVTNPKNSPLGDRAASF